MPRDDQPKENAKSTMALKRRDLLLSGSSLMVASALSATSLPATARAQQAAPTGRKPNILVIFGDDVGISNISAYSNGLMGYETPNIDRIGREGIKFLHYYGEQSCTAGRAAFLTGQHGIRTGLTKVGFPGAPMGMSQLDPSIGGIMVGASSPAASRANGRSSTSASRVGRRMACGSVSSPLSLMIPRTST